VKGDHEITKKASIPTADSAPRTLRSKTQQALPPEKSDLPQSKPTPAIFVKLYDNM
jgi:hypothetical protein